MRRYIGDSTAAWSVGIWGGIGEFRLDVDEPRDLDIDALTIVTKRGGLRITPVNGVLALEIQGTDSDHIEEIAFCLPVARFERAPSAVLAEAGPDGDALRATDREHILFDLGLNAAHVEAFVRVPPRDAALLTPLRAAAGQSLLDGHNGAAAALRAASPPRIFRSPLARLEIYDTIPPPGGRSPEGPHSHILPGLLRQRRAHAPGSPIPDDWYCCLSLYPGAPM